MNDRTDSPFGQSPTPWIGQIGLSVRGPKPWIGSGGRVTFSRGRARGPISPVQVSVSFLPQPLQPQKQTGRVKGNSAPEASVPEMDMNLLHPAVKDLNLVPVQGDLPMGWGAGVAETYHLRQ